MTRSILFAVLAAAPFAVSAGTMRQNLEPASIEHASPEQIALDFLSREVAPSTCRDAKPVSEQATADYATGCCWIFFYGRWYCVPC
jgi:hypothetical protein